MPDWLSESLKWIVTASLLVGGVAGVFLPVLPGHLLIVIAAAGHWLMFGDAAGVGWVTMVVLGLLLVASQIAEYLSGAIGTRWFGGTRWGVAGAIVGGLAGFFFMPIGLLAGPLVGAFLFEWLFAKKEVRPATVSGVGSVVGTLAGLMIKVAIALVMVAYFLADVFWIS